MLYQLHWQYKDGTTEMKAQREITSHDEMREFIKEIIESRPLPDGIIWMACNEKSEHFVLAKSEI